MLLTRRVILHSIWLPLLASPAPAVPAGTPVRVVWVYGDPPAPAEAAGARRLLAAALAYWAEAACYVAGEAAASLDPYQTHTWMERLVTPGAVTVCVVCNQRSRRYVDLGGGIAAPAYNWPGKGVCYVSLWAGPEYSHLDVGGQASHELGHALYGLPDGDPNHLMMRSPSEAWAARGRCE